MPSVDAIELTVLSSSHIFPIDKLKEDFFPKSIWWNASRGPFVMFSVFLGFYVNPFTATCRIYPAPADISQRHITEISGEMRIGCIGAWRKEYFVYSVYKYHS